jgi:hypothetical protein
MVERPAGKGGRFQAGGFSRRAGLGGLLGLGAAAGLSGSRAMAGRWASPVRSVAAENQLPGTDSWRLTSSRIEPTSRFRSPWVEGYASATSVRPGERLQLMVSASESTQVAIDIFRMGYYGGLGGRQVAQFGPLTVTSQAEPAIGEQRLRDCAWEPTLELSIPLDWISGVYLAKLTELGQGLQSYIIFIVRDDAAAQMLFQCSDLTWQAYNRWPSQYALYDDGRSQWYWGGGVSVGFDRPYGKYCQIFDAPLSLGSGEFLLWEFPLAYWLESQGWQVSYISNLDTHRDPEGLERAPAFLSVGHDEYYTLEMFRNLQRAVDRGVSLAFLSGNTAFGRVRLGPDARGVADRVFERVGIFGPPGGTRVFDSIDQLPHERPYGHELIGAHSTGEVTGGGDWVCRLPEHWLFEGTGMRAGDAIPGLVGWEWHGDPAPIPGLEVVASGPTRVQPGGEPNGYFTATLYPGPAENWVFNAGTVWWADGLSEPPGYVRPSVYTTPSGPDPRVQRITRNLLERMCGGGPEAGVG